MPALFQQACGDKQLSVTYLFQEKSLALFTILPIIFISLIRAYILHLYCQVLNLVDTLYGKQKLIRQELSWQKVWWWHSLHLLFF